MLFSLLLVILCDHVHHVFGITCEGFLMDHPDKKICRKSNPLFSLTKRLLWSEYNYRHALELSEDSVIN